MINLTELKNNIKTFLNEYFPSDKILYIPAIYDNEIATTVLCEDYEIKIWVIVDEFSSDIVFETHFGSNSEDYDDLSLQKHIYYITNKDETASNIKSIFKEAYPKFEATIKPYINEEKKMKEYEKLQKEIKKFLKEYLTEKQIVSKPIIYDDRIIEEIYVDNVLIIINIIIGEHMSDIILDAFFGGNSELYENQSITIRLHNIPNEEMQSDNIIKAFKEIYPKFEKMVKYYKILKEL